MSYSKITLSTLSSLPEDLRSNPLLQPSDLPYGAPHFERIREEHYLPAFKVAIDICKKEVDAIISSPDSPTFRNTVVELEYCGLLLNDIEGVFFNLLEADSTPRMEEIAQEVSPLLTELQMYISLNPDLFRKVSKVYGDFFSTLEVLTSEQFAPFIGKDGMAPSDVKLLRDCYRSFVMGGAALPSEAQEELRSVGEELSLLELKFSSNTLASTNAFTLDLEDEESLAGLPQYLIDLASHTAEQNGKKGWCITLHSPLYRPFLKYSSVRSLREKIWREYNTRAMEGEYSNSELVGRIVKLRGRKAELLGYPTYGDYALQTRMASSRDTVMAFLSDLLVPTVPVAKKEVEELSAYAMRRGFEGELQPWDFSFWAEKYRQEKFSLSDDVLKPYFKLEDCIDAVFSLATTLYGVTFTPRPDIPLYHPDVKVFEVKDGDGKGLSLFYADFFPRPSKKGGAWMTEFRGQFTDVDGKDTRPLISIVTNFSPSTPSSPSLLTHDELTTFLHEFGHALHGMLSRGKYPSQCGTSVQRDFVELPSQIMENWAFEKQWLDTFAHHYRTGEKIPAEILHRIVESRNYLSAYAQIRQLRFCYLDMAWHSLDCGTLSALPSKMEASDVEAFENKATEGLSVLPEITPSCTSTTFGHIFSGGYSAGYYSYKWAEVLEADAFSLFQQKGIFSTEVASSFRRNILEKGSSEDAAILYRNFRGHAPSVEALLVKSGILSPGQGSK